MKQWRLLSWLTVGLIAVLYLVPSGSDQYHYHSRTESSNDYTAWKGAEAYYKSIRGNLESGNVSTVDVAMVEKEIQRGKRTSDGLALQLEPLGPDNIGGRTRAILVDRKNGDRVYAGSVSGGLYYSDNAGGTWNPHANFINTAKTSSIIGSIAQAPNGDVYVGTGCTFESRSGPTWPGKGIAVSRDGGSSFDWITLNSIGSINQKSETWHAVNRMAFDPSTSRLYAGTQRGLRTLEWNGDEWENPVPLIGTTPFNLPAMDVAVADDGTVLTVVGGRVFHSDNGDVNTFENVTGNGFDSTKYARVVLAIAPSNNNIVYAATVSEKGFQENFAFHLEGIYKSEDKGLTWHSLIKRDERNFAPMGDQGRYNLALTVDPLDAGKLFVGGVQMWQYDGDWHRHTAENFSSFSPNYLHADKHVFTYDPQDPSVMYVGSDGGVSKSEDGGETFLVVNKGYLSSQFYGVAFTPNQELVFGGTQDNGTNGVLNDNPKDPFFGFQVFRHDGFDAEASQYFPILFATSQRSLVVRLDASNVDGGSLPTNEISAPYTSGAFLPDGGVAFHTVIRLWESIDDPTSKDNITFGSSRESHAIPRDNDFQREFEESVRPFQSSAIPIEKSLIIRAGSQVILSDQNASGVLEGDEGEGTVEYMEDGSVLVDFQLDDFLSTGLNLTASFEVRYEANAVLQLKSATGGRPFEHVLESAMNPGDEIQVRDPVQSLLMANFRTTAPDSSSTDNGLALTRDALKLEKSAVEWLEIHGIGQVTCAEFSQDGNHLFVGAGLSYQSSFTSTNTGRVFRISGLNDFYSNEDRDKLEITEIFSHDQTVTGIALDWNDPNRLVVTLGNYGQQNYVYYTKNALSFHIFNPVQGDLPAMPVYDAEIDVNDPGIVLLGTDFGIWSTSNIDAPDGVEWADENPGSGGLTYLPVFDVRQQKLGFGQSKNHYQYYFGTHGRGIWKTGTLVALGTDDEFTSKVEETTLLKVAPNPINRNGRFLLESSNQGKATVSIIDLQGRLVQQKNASLNRGANEIPFELYGLPNGMYLAVVETDGQRLSTRIMVANE